MASHQYSLSCGCRSLAPTPAASWSVNLKTIIVATVEGPYKGSVWNSPDFTGISLLLTTAFASCVAIKWMLQFLSNEDIRHQAITWASVDWSLCHHMASPDNNVFKCIVDVHDRLNYDNAIIDIKETPDNKFMFDTYNVCLTFWNCPLSTALTLPILVVALDSCIPLDKGLFSAILTLSSKAFTGAVVRCGASAAICHAGSCMPHQQY